MKPQNFHLKWPRQKLFPFLLLLTILVIYIFSCSFVPLDNFLKLMVPTSGLLFYIFGMGIFFYLHPRAGLVPLLMFFWLSGACLILAHPADTNPALNYLEILCFAFIPPTLFHFTRLISEIFFNVGDKKIFFAVPYLLSIPALAAYPFWNASIVYMIFYLAGVYLAWLGRMIWYLKTPHPQLEKIILRFLLLGQVVGFLLPLAIAALVWRWSPYRWDFAAPLVLFFPISLPIGLIPGQKRQQQTYLVQSEKRVAFGNLLAGLSHELNNPLNFIYSALEPLRESHQYLQGTVKNPDEKTKEIFQDLEKIVGNMEKGVLRAEAILKQFRDFPSSRQKEKQEIDLEGLIDKCIELLAHKWTSKVRLQRDYQGVPNILGRTVELEQVFTNILSNAFDASPNGGIVKISSHRAAAGVKIVIQDMGQGIPKETIGKIFDPFFTTKGQGEGTGLGLAISLQIIKNHRGSIEVISDAGEGTQFLIFLPY